MIALEWLRSHDAGLGALRRAGRTAIVMPGLFALGTKVIGSPQVATFAAFGAFAMLLFVDFQGSTRQRLEAHLTLSVVGGGFVCLGTLASHHAVVAAIGMALVGFAVLFSGVVSSVLAGAATSLLIAFILPVTTLGPNAAIPARLAGWGLASAAAIIAVTVLWPAPERHPLRVSAVAAARLLGARLRAETAFFRGEAGRSLAELEQASAKARSEVTRMQGGFYGSAYRPTGLGSPDRALVRLVDELGWLSSIADGAPADDAAHAPAHSVLAVESALAELLEAGSVLLEAPRGHGSDLGAELRHLQAALADMEFEATGSLPVLTRDAPDRARAVVSSLEPAFRAQEMSYAGSVIAANMERVVAAEGRSSWERLLGHQPEGISGPLSAVHARAAAQVERHSVWLRNSLRGAAALAAAVLVADLTGVQHSFWVVLGTLSVLRTSALHTGQNALRGIVGTAGGFVAGGLLIAAVGTNTEVLWFLLPVAVLLAGLAPTTVSFAAGQGAFTLTLVILYNIIAPVGWHVGLARVGDIAIGCSVSLVVGLMFWPRGAGAVLGEALAEAYAESAGYLRSAVAFGVRQSRPVPDPAAGSRAAAAAAGRLDNAFRSYLAERGGKPVPLAEVTALITGVAGLRLAADAVLDLWTAEGAAPCGRGGAQSQLLASVAGVSDWYVALADGLAGRGPLPGPAPGDPVAERRLLDAVRGDLFDDDAQGTAMAVRTVWTADHIDAARRLEALLVEPARAAAAGRRPSRLH